MFLHPVHCGVAVARLKDRGACQCGTRGCVRADADFPVGSVRDAVVGRVAVANRREGLESRSSSAQRVRASARCGRCCLDPVVQNQWHGASLKLVQIAAQADIRWEWYCGAGGDFLASIGSMRHKIYVPIRSKDAATVCV